MPLYIPVIMKFMPGLVPHIFRTKEIHQQMNVTETAARREALAALHSYLPSNASQPWASYPLPKVIETIDEDRERRGAGALPGLEALSMKELKGCCSVFALGHRVPFRIQLVKRIERHVRAIDEDDGFLRKEQAFAELDDDEVNEACHERGIEYDSPEHAREQLKEWVEATNNGALLSNPVKFALAQALISSSKI
jgi:hypothetical protein